MRLNLVSILFAAHLFSQKGGQIDVFHFLPPHYPRVICAQCNGSCESCEPFTTDFNFVHDETGGGWLCTRHFFSDCQCEATVWYRAMFYVQKPRPMKCLFSTTNATNTPLKSTLQGHHFFLFTCVIEHEHTPVLNGSPDGSALAVFSIVCTTGTRTLGLAWVPISEWRKQLHST